MIFTYFDLKNAWKAESKRKHYAANHAKYEYNIELNLFDLKDELVSDSFLPSKLRNKNIYVPKRRVAQVPSMKDKIVQHLICDNYLYRSLTKPLISNTYACIIGRGTSDADICLKKHLRRFWNKNHKQPYILKCDIHNYFASIDHERAESSIGRYVLDDDVRHIVVKFLHLTDVGLPLGVQQNQLLANLFLSELDNMIKSKWHAKYYGRYMDDFYILSDDIHYLEWLLSNIKSYVESIGLELNPKTNIFYRRFDFLGFSYFLTDTGKVVKRLSSSKKKTQRRRIRLMARKLRDGLITESQAAASYQGWRNHALSGGCRCLVLDMDQRFKKELSNIGYSLRIIPYKKKNKRKERVLICHEH